MTIQQLDALTVDILKLKEEKDTIKKVLSEVEKKLIEKEFSVIELMTEHEKDKWEVKGVGSLSLSSRDYWQILDHQTLAKHFIKNDEFEMIKINTPSVQGYFSSMKADYAENGHEFMIAKLQENCGVKAFTKMRLTRRKK